MKFNTPAFVRVENPQERKELIKWLESIGRVSKCYDDREEYILAINTYTWHTYSTIDHIAIGMFKDMHDCGTNIPLFKALSAMNDENDREQLFLNPIGSMYVVCYDTIYNELGLIPDKWRKATAEEIINHFKNQKS